jgi:hypothetical protein
MVLTCMADGSSQWAFGNDHILAHRCQERGPSTPSGHYPEAKTLLITADGGGSNGSRVRLWKRELQSLANELGIEITVCHLPPGTSKWNKIEHRLFSFITQNWRGRPLISYQTIVQLIAATTTQAGLKVRCEIEANTYPKGVKVEDDEMAALKIRPHDFHSEWNYTISPRTLN